MTATTGSTAMPGTSAASVMPAMTTDTEATIGRRTPERSTSRPENTPSAIGSAAISETSTPTVSGVAPSESASQREREAGAVVRGVREDGDEDDQRERHRCPSYVIALSHHRAE